MQNPRWRNVTATSFCGIRQRTLVRNPSVNFRPPCAQASGVNAVRWWEDAEQYRDGGAVFLYRYRVARLIRWRQEDGGAGSTVTTMLKRARVEKRPTPL